MSVTFKVKCPHCGKKHAIPQQFVGKVVLCQPCGQNFLVEGDPTPPKPKSAPPKPVDPEEAFGAELLQMFDGEDEDEDELRPKAVDPSESELIDLDALDRADAAEDKFESLDLD